jgi:hypothetical protein
MKMNPGWRAMTRARAVIRDNASSCFSDSDSTSVICLTHCMPVRTRGIDVCSGLFLREPAPLPRFSGRCCLLFLVFSRAASFRSAATSASASLVPMVALSFVDHLSTASCILRLATSDSRFKGSCAIVDLSRFVKQPIRSCHFLVSRPSQSGQQISLLR